MPRVASLIRLLTIERLLQVILFIGFALGISGYSSDGFLHLATGKYILANKALPAGDPFSFTRPGAEWVMHEWLWQVWLYLVYLWLGFMGLKLLGAVLLTASISISVRCSKLLGAGYVTAWLTTIVLFLTWNGYVGIRPHIVTYLFFVFTLYALLRYRQLGKERALYLIPFLMPLWVNSHGGFIVGLVLLGYFLVLYMGELRLKSGGWRVPWPLAITFLLALMTSLINPYGYEQLLFPFQLMNQWALGYITEWQPLELASWQGVVYLVGVVMFLSTLALVDKHERLFRLLLTLPFAIAAFKANRHLPLAAFVMTPFLAQQLELSVGFIKKQRRHAEPLGMARSGRHDLGAVEYLFNWLILGAVCIAIYMAYPAYLKYEARAIRNGFPIEATRYLMEHPMQGRMFTSMEYSTYILFARYPDQKLFYDVRVEMYGNELARDYITMVYALDGWQKLFDTHAIDYAVLDKSKPIYTAIAADKDFDKVYEDEYSAIYRRRMKGAD